MTYQQLQQLCQRQSGNRSADGLQGFKDYLNFAQKQVAGSLLNWPELQSNSTLSLTQGTEGYPLASDFDKMRKIVITTANYKRELKRVNYPDFRSAVPNTSDDAQGEPIYWYISPSSPTTLRVYPLPDRAYTASYDYIKTVTDMSADADTPFFPGRWHHILPYLALALHYESSKESNFDKANYYRTLFQDGLERLVSDYNGRSLTQGEFRIAYDTGVNEGENEW